MENKIICNQHQVQIIYLCIRPNCCKKLLCQQCIKVVSGDCSNQHQLIEYSVKSKIQCIREKNNQKLSIRLLKIMNIMRSRTQKQLNKIHCNISQDIKNYSNSYYQNLWNNSIIPAYIRQIERDNFNGLNKNKIEQVILKLKQQMNRIIDEDMNLKPNEEQLIAKIAQQITSQIQIIQKIFWRKSDEKLTKSIIFFEKSLSVQEIIQKYKNQIQLVKRLNEKNLKIITQMAKRNNEISFEKLDMEKSYKTINPIIQLVKFDQITKLNLRNCNIKYLQFFRHKNLNFSKLKYLDLGYNGIYSIDPLIEFDMPNLSRMNLQYNNLYTIQSLIKLNCKNVKIFVLTNNNIKTINQIQKFTKFNQLQQIYLDGNMIQSLRPLCKLKLPKIQKIAIRLPQYQKIQELPFEDNTLKSKIWHYMT